MTDKEQQDRALLLKRSLAAINDLQAQLAAARRAASEPIAIVGMSCRFPGGADTPEAYWDLLMKGTDTVTEVPRDRWDMDQFFDPDPDAPGKTYTRWGAFLDGLRTFDAGLFGVSPREAIMLDPQQRMLLEVTWEALERAGIAPSSVAGSQTAVYVGVSTNDYANYLGEAIGLYNGNAYAGSGCAHSMASGRLAYAFDFHGPNAAVDTACSSSHVALHWAVQSLRNGEADMAVSAGVSLILMPIGSILTARARMMSFDGHCKSFDAAADGYVRGEGCGALILKRLSDAQRDGDNILGLIRGTALNQDGRSSGLTAPNGKAQAAVLRAALKNAGLTPDDIDCVEAHGTGTSLGDPIEVNALSEVFGGRDKTRPLLISSVKANIGHAEAAAGIAGVIKGVLMLQHGAMPPQLHLRTPNPLIPWDSIPIEVPLVPTVLRRREGVPLRVGVSSFGFSGSNGHVVLEEAPLPAADPEVVPAPARLLVLSAHNTAGLKDLVRRYVEFMARGDAPEFARIVQAAAQGRSHLGERLALVAADNSAAGARLQSFLDGDASACARGRASGGTEPEIVFMFTGQGSQYAGMARELYATQPVFRESLDRCAALADPLLPRPLRDVIAGEGDCAGLLDDTTFTQPALFAVEYSLAQLLRSWGVEPAAAMGHSVGEFVAACVAGVFSLEDGLRLICARARLMGALPPGGTMVAVFSDEETVLRELAASEGNVAIAAVNGPTNTVISGACAAVEKVVARLAARGIDTQRLAVSHAFHSSLMEPMLAEFAAELAKVTFSSPRITVVSNLTGRVAGSEIATPDYWLRHLREAVRFSDSVATLLREGYRVFLEVGPSATLLGMVSRCPGTESAVMLASLRKGRDDVGCLLESLASLHVRGQRLRWNVLPGYTPFARRQVAIPTYPFQRQEYWQERELAVETGRLQPLHDASPLLSGRLEGPLPSCQGEIALSRHAWLSEFRLFDFGLLPPAAVFEFATAAASELLGSAAFSLHDLSLRDCLRLPADGVVTLQAVLSEDREGRHVLQVFSRESGSEANGVEVAWCLRATAEVVREAGAEARIALPVQAADAPQMEVDRFFKALGTRGAELGPAFRGLTDIRSAGGLVTARVRLPAALSGSSSSFVLHPALLESALLLAEVAVPGRADAADGFLLPGHATEYRVWQAGVDAARISVRIQQASADGNALQADVLLHSEDGSLIAQVSGLSFRRLSRARLRRMPGGATAHSPGKNWLYEVEWRQIDPVAGAVRTAGQWVVLTDEGRLGSSLVEHLTGKGAGVSVLRAGAALRRRSDGWEVDTQDPQSIRAALDAVAAETKEGLAGIISLWSLPREDVAASLEPEVIRAAQQRAIMGCLPLARALADIDSRLWVITRGAQSVAGSVPDVAQTAMAGLGNVLAAEVPMLRCVRIDLDPQPRSDEPDVLFNAIWNSDNDDRVALRAGQRYVARLIPGVLDEQGKLPIKFNPEGSYLITGGLGGLGLAFSHWLADRGAKHLVLLGRRAPSREAEQDLRALRESGVEVRVAAVDVSSEAAVAGLLREIAAGMPPLRGILHAAGIVDDGILAEQTWARFERAMAPKVNGAWNLHVHTKGLPLDFFVMFSSAAALLGSPGQGNYATANAFLDGMAAWRRSQGLAAVSINWGSWSSIGMAADVGDQHHRRWEAMGLRMIAPEAGVQMLEEILVRSPSSQVAALPLMPERLPRGAPFLSGIVENGSAPDQAAGGGSQGRILAQLVDSQSGERRELLQAYLCEQLVLIFALGSGYVVEADRSLMEMGMDSLMAVELRNRLQADLKVSVAVADLLAGPSVTELADQLLAQVGQQADPEPAEEWEEGSL